MIKILFTIAIVYAVWFVFKHQKRIVAAHKEVQEKKARAAAKAAAATAPIAQDLLPCPRCGAYVAAGQAHTCEGAHSS